MVKCIAECDRPAVRLNGFTLGRLKTDDRCLLPRVPDSDTSVRTTSDQFRSSVFCAFTTNAVDLVSHIRMRLDLELRNAPLDIVDDQLAFVVDSGTVSDADWGGLESAALDSELLLPLSH